jgi:large subunit ribosomal protein L7/L12
MSAPASRALRRCVCNATATPAYLRPTAPIAQQRTSRRWQSTEAAAPTNPKIATIVDQISQLTLLETADLVSTLKVRLSPTRKGSKVGDGAASPGAIPKHNRLQSPLSSLAFHSLVDI